jgi:hypothetical protein
MENLHSRRRKKHRNREVEANTRKNRIPKRDRRKRNQQDNRRKIKYWNQAIKNYHPQHKENNYTSLRQQKSRQLL